MSQQIYEDGCKKNPSAKQEGEQQVYVSPTQAEQAKLAQAEQERDTQMSGRKQASHEGFFAKFGHAKDGFFSALRSERNLRIHCVVAVFALLACFALRVQPMGWIAVIIMIVLVISAELFNTALENLCDLVSPEQNPFIKRAKDASAAAVLILAIGSVVIGLAIYIPAFMRIVVG